MLLQMLRMNIEAFLEVHSDKFLFQLVTIELMQPSRSNFFLLLCFAYVHYCCNCFCVCFVWCRSSSVWD